MELTDKLFHGVYAALLTPRLEDGTPDFASLHDLVVFLRGHGISRYAVNGATGEFCLTLPSELRDVLAAVGAAGGAGIEILCGVGAAGQAETAKLVHIAEEAKVQGLLLPMPYFFPYDQDDLVAFSEAVASATPLPILLYNLPQFTSGLDPETVCRLVEQVPTIVGVKDSSGSLDIVTALTERLPQACRIIGNDSALAPALRGHKCDGVVSGVACVLPELISALFQAEPDSPEFAARAKHLDTFIKQLNVFPTPWGLKWAAQGRDVLPARFSLPVSAQRAEQAHVFQQWLRSWLPETLASLSLSQHP